MGRGATDLTGQGATVMISMTVRQAHTDEYQRWQHEMDEVAQAFPGFEATELYPPTSTEEGVWVVVFRFAHLDQLTAWLDSPERRDLATKGEHLFEGKVAQEVLAGEAPDREMVTAVIPHDVRPGREREFEHWQETVRRVQEKSPGFKGYELFRPVAGLQDKWVAVVRYDTREHLDEWLQSDAREKLLANGKDYYTDYEVKTINSAFSGWFRFGKEAKGIPPNWKQAMSVLLALYPIVVVLSLTLDRGLGTLGVPAYLAIFAGNVVSVSALTWLLMPLVNRIFAYWLRPDPTRSRRRELAGAATVVGCYVAFIAIFAWIMT